MQSAQHYSQGLYIIATPIGNMRDITLRALEALGNVDVIACEDTRQTGKLLAAHGLAAKMTPFHEHNTEAVRPKIIQMIREGRSVALVTDAGMPLISDPGYKLVRDCRAAGLLVTCLPGPCAALTGLAVSGLPTNTFFFAGFLPAKSQARRKALQAFAAIPSTLIFYETAHRLVATLYDMYNILGDRHAAVARELTKKFEETRSGTLQSLQAYYADNGAPKGEIVVLVDAPDMQTKSYTEADIDAALKAALQDNGLKDAAARVAEATGWKKKDIYARGLVMKQESDDKNE